MGFTKAGRSWEIVVHELLVVRLHRELWAGLTCSLHDSAQEEGVKSMLQACQQMRIRIGV